MIRASLCRRRCIAHASLAVALLGCAVLMIVPPTRASFYPACPIHQLLGIDCPGCGATRALAALLHGHVREAIRLNALFVLLLPAALAFAALLYRRAIGPGEFRWPRPPASGVYAGIVVSAIFTIARNVIR